MVANRDYKAISMAVKNKCQSFNKLTHCDMSCIIKNFILLQMHALMIKLHIKLYYSKKKKKKIFWVLHVVLMQFYSERLVD